jgi:cytochrome c oxidase subunit II
MLNGWWLPQAISSHAVAHDQQFMRTLGAAAFIFVVAQIALFAIAWRYRSRSRGSAITGASTGSRAEFYWTSATAVLFLGLLALGGRTWARVQFTPPPEDAESIDVLAKQFAWNFRYSGPDKRFGRTSIRMIDDAAGNPFGLIETDPAANDDIVSATLRIPAGRPVNLNLRSLDVVHSFFIRELRIKQDLVPGMEIPLHFQADVPGSYEVPCAELCGLGHHQMRAMVIVMDPVAFDAWKREQVR